MNHISSASADTTVKLWDTDTWQELRSYENHTNMVFDCTFSQDGKMIVSGANDYIAKVWDVYSNREIASFAGHFRMIFSCAFFPDNNHMVTASEDFTLKIWNLNERREVAALEGHVAGINSCAISHDGKYVISASLDETIRIWDVSHLFHVDNSEDTINIESEVVDRYEYYSYSSKMSEDGLFYDDDCAILYPSQTNAINIFAHSPCRHRILGKIPSNPPEEGPFYYEVKVADEGSRQIISNLTKANPCECAYSFDGSRMIIAKNREIEIWSAITNEMITSLPTNEDMSKFTLSPDGESILVAETVVGDFNSRIKNNHIGCYSLVDGSLCADKEYTKVTERLTSEWGSVWDVELSPDGAFLVLFMLLGDIIVWDLYNNEEFVTFSSHSKPVVNYRFSPDGTLLVTASMDTSLKVFSITQKKEICTLFEFGNADIMHISPRFEIHLRKIPDLQSIEIFKLNNIEPLPPVVIPIKQFNFEVDNWEDNYSFYCSWCDEPTDLPSGMCKEWGFVEHGQLPAKGTHGTRSSAGNRSGKGYYTCEHCQGKLDVRFLARNTIDSLFFLVNTLIERNDLYKALVLICDNVSSDHRFINALSVIYMRLGFIQEALDSMRVLLFTSDGLSIDESAPDIYIVNFATALALDGREDGVISALDCLKNTNDKTALKLWSMIQERRANLSLWKRLTGHSDTSPFSFDFPPGIINTHGDSSCFHPDNLEFPVVDQYLYGLALFKSERFNDACNVLTLYLDEWHDKEATMLLSECLYQLGEFDQSILQYQNVIKHFKGDVEVPRALLGQALSFRQLGDDETALIIFKKIRNKYPETPEAKQAQDELKKIWQGD